MVKRAAHTIPSMPNQIRIFAFAAMMVLCGSAFCTPAITIPPAVLQAVHALDPAAHIAASRAGPVPGLFEISTGRTLLEVSDNGRYVFEGHLFDLKRGVDLATLEANGWRSRIVAGMPNSSFITFAPARPRFVVTVFTDPSCAYCQIMAGQIHGYLAAGIELRFAAYPAEMGASTGNPILARIWCARKPRAAFVAAFTQRIEPPANRYCGGVLKTDEAAAVRLQLPGTPSLIGLHGSLLGGYLSPRNLLAKLVLDSAATETN